MNEKVQERVRNAYLKHEFVLLLRGEEPYQITPNRFVPAKQITDWELLLTQGVYALYPVYGDDVSDMLRAAIITLANGSPLDCWIAYRVYFIQFCNEKTDDSPFCIITTSFMNHLRECLRKNEQALKEMHADFTNESCLWDDIAITDTVLANLYGVTVV